MSSVVAVEPVLPKHRYPQARLAEALVDVIGVDGGTERLLRRIHEHCGVDYRHIAMPIEHYSALDNFGDANNAFITAAQELGTEAVVGALARASLQPDDVDLIASTTVTGIAVPSIEARIAADLRLRDDVVRLPLMGLGCMGGAAGVARVHDYLRGNPRGVAVLLSVELCSLTIQRGDTSTANLVASGLFSDGAAAVVMVGADHDLARADSEAAGSPRVVATGSRLYAQTQDVMGWDVGSTGLRIVLGAEVPDLVREQVGGDVARFLGSHGLRVDDVGWWVCHPGGPKVIDALDTALGVDPDALALTSASLQRVGNLSSASVLHILRDTLDQRPPAPGSYGVMMAMGPGFSLELVLLRMPEDEVRHG